MLALYFNQEQRLSHLTRGPIKIVTLKGLFHPLSLPSQDISLNSELLKYISIQGLSYCFDLIFIIFRLVPYYKNNVCMLQVGKISNINKCHKVKKVKFLLLVTPMKIFCVFILSGIFNQIPLSYTFLFAITFPLIQYQTLFHSF